MAGIGLVTLLSALLLVFVSFGAGLPLAPMWAGA